MQQTNKQRSQVEWAQNYFAQIPKTTLWQRNKNLRLSGREIMCRGKALPLIRQKCAGEKIHSKVKSGQVTKIIQKSKVWKNHETSEFVWANDTFVTSRHNESECEVEEGESGSGGEKFAKKRGEEGGEGGKGGEEGAGGGSLDRRKPGGDGGGDAGAVWSRSDSGYICPANFSQSSNISHLSSIFPQVSGRRGWGPQIHRKQRWWSGRGRRWGGWDAEDPKKRGKKGIRTLGPAWHGLDQVSNTLHASQDKSSHIQVLRALMTS